MRPAHPSTDSTKRADPESLRDQRRRQLRQQLSEVATQLFLEHGFDAVLVADVARACGVAEKTVFNHFRSKESLLLDRWDELVAAVSEHLVDSRTPAVSAVVQVLDKELDELTGGGAATREDVERIVRFGELVSSTPSLLAHRRRELQRLTDTISAAITARHHSRYADPEVQIIAEALTGLFAVFYRSLARHSRTLDAAACRRQVRRDMRRAAGRLTAGITG